MKKRKTAKNSRGFSKYLMSILLLLLFEAVAVTLWLTKDNLFYLLNFSYIGGCLALGTAPVSYTHLDVYKRQRPR